MSTTSDEQKSNSGDNSDEVWNGWRPVETTGNYTQCGNNIILTLQKGDNTCVYSASNYIPIFRLEKINGKSASGTFNYEGLKSQAEVYNAFTEFIESQINANNS
ncbi:unnamed protein product [Rotaria sordida]|nr:unnamed protein product [Rotaria sordida]